MKLLMRYRLVLLYVLFFIFMVGTIALKENYHIDEIFTYGLSNNRGSISLQVEDGKEYDPSAVYASYLVTDQYDRFSYDIVWQNQENDVHPPLYYGILHTISSFFPGVFSKYFAGMVNIIFAMGTLFVVQKILPFFCDNKTLCELMSFAFVVSSGILSAVSFLRMYIMAMFWVTLLVYLYLREVEQKKITIKFFIKVYAVTSLGALTHYYCIIFAVFISVVYGIYLVTRKAWIRVFLFCVSMGLAGLSSYLIFPAMVNHMFSGYRGEQAMTALGDLSDFWVRTKVYFGFLDKQMFGGFLGYILVIVLFYGLLRMLSQDSPKIIMSGVNCEKLTEDKYELIRYSLLWIPIILYFFTVAKISPYQTDRYLFPVYAIAFVGLLCLVIRIAKALFVDCGVKIFACILLGIITVGSWKNIGWPYLYTNTKTLLEEAANYNDVACICIYDVNWKLHPAFLEARQYASITFVSIDNSELLECLKNTNEYTELVLMIVGDCDKKQLVSEFKESSEVMKKSKTIGGYSYGTSYYLYK